MISRRTPSSPSSSRFQRSSAVACGLCSVLRTNIATTSAGSEHRATSLCRTKSRTSRPRNCAASRPAKKTDHKLQMRPPLYHRHLCRTTHRHRTICLPSVSAPKSRGPRLPISNKATARQPRPLSGADAPVLQTRPLLEPSAKPAIPCALHTHRTTSASASLSLAVPMRTLQEMSTTTTMTTMTTRQVVTATTMLDDSSPGVLGTTSRDRDAIRARKTVGETWRRRRIWWLELVVEVLQLSKLSCSDHAFHSKPHNILESVRKRIVYDSHVLVQSRVMFSASNQSTRSF
jgi:hypothetical protein